jgi:hypothetical protein
LVNAVIGFIFAFPVFSSICDPVFPPFENLFDAETDEAPALGLPARSLHCAKQVSYKLCHCGPAVGCSRNVVPKSLTEEQEDNDPVPGALLTLAFLLASFGSG